MGLAFQPSGEFRRVLLNKLLRDGEHDRFLFRGWKSSGLFRRARRTLQWIRTIVCADDAAAIEKAKRLVNRYGIELWNGARLVVRLEPVQSSHDLHQADAGRERDHDDRDEERPR